MSTSEVILISVTHQAQYGKKGMVLKYLTIYSI